LPIRIPNILPSGKPILIKGKTIHGEPKIKKRSGRLKMKRSSATLEEKPPKRKRLAMERSAEEIERERERERQAKIY